MADPLSIAASVAGLLATAGKICSVLSTFVLGVIDAPQSARDALATVEEVRLALKMVKGLVDTVSALPSRRRVLVRLDHMAITFSNCVLTLSELESLVCFKDGMLHRLRWVWGENRVLRLLPRLESQKTSLSLMASVLLCQSEVGALESRERLNAAVDLILQRSGADFAARVRSLDGMQVPEDRSVRFYDGDSMIDQRRLSTMTSLGSGSLPYPAPSSSSKTGFEAGLANNREFEAILERSRVYSRVESSESDMSFTSSAVRSHAWSVLSLNDISIVAVFRLPITLDDINRFGPGLTFAGLLQGRGVPAVSGLPDLEVDTSHAEPVASPSMADISQALERASTDSQGYASSTSGLQPNAQSRTAIESARVGSAPAQKVADGKRPLLPIHSTRGDRTIKLVAVGDPATLKTETLIAYTTNQFPSEYVPTVYDDYAFTIMIGDDPYTVALFDTAGHEDYDRLRPLSYPGTDVFLIFTRIGSKASYDNAEQKWIPEVTCRCPGVPFLIVGVGDDEILDRTRKSGLPHKHEDYTRMGEGLASRLGAVKYVECNVFTQWRLKDVFDEAIVAALEPPQVKRRLQKRSLRPYKYFLRTVKEIKEED